LKKIITTKKFESIIHIDDLENSQAIFSYKNGEIHGMIICAQGEWCLKIESEKPYNGWFSSREDLINSLNRFEDITLHIV
jgi:hypothetical protein